MNACTHKIKSIVSILHPCYIRTVLMIMNACIYNLKSVVSSLTINERNKKSGILVFLKSWQNIK
jgi:hypothetical protein